MSSWWINWGTMAIFYITEHYSLTRSPFLRLPHLSVRQHLPPKRQLRPRASSHLHSVLAYKNMPQTCVSHHCHASTWANPLTFRLGCHRLWQVSRGVPLNTAGRGVLSHFLPARSLLWCHVCCRAARGRSGPKLSSHHWPSRPVARLPH